MYINKEGMMIYTSYEFDRHIRPNYALIQVQKEKSLPFFINHIHFIQKCYHYYANDNKINLLIHNIFDMANNQKKYYHFKTIKKRNGKDRLLSIPNDDLMYVLKYINHNVLSWYKPLPCVSAYVKGKKKIYQILVRVSKKWASYPLVGRT